ncbi:efflux transporter outer membrane subunit [Alloacidobacterium dinghuense]|uniref:Efflux transporter outer membrane subunit n=1 Tax=Alloacidobacterium dinghuense TaxID=2763107 RepID=A0A7G8BQK3_9BACT|nr:efflux transporter outer membrane subunit [Alloacidobacterium dinghuense]
MIGSGLLLSSLLVACTPGPKYHAPAPPAPTAKSYKESTINFQDANGWKVASPQDGMLRGKWWEIFHDEELNGYEEQLDVNNQNIKQSFENLMAARALIREARAQYWPTVTAGASWNRSKTSGNLTHSSTANAGFTSSTWSLPLDVSWTPDFFGKIRNEVREAQNAAQVSAADLENEKLIEQATLAETYFQLRGQDALEKVLNDTVESDKKALELNKTLYETGINDYLSVAAAESTLKSAESAALNVGVTRAQFEHAIATLLGKPASDFSIAVKPLLIVPPPIPTGVPSQLLERRPDVAATERTIAQANATIGIGYGAFFPSVTLSAAGGFESSTFQHWFDWPSRFWSIGPSFSQLIYDGGLYRATLHQYQATYNADVAIYRQTTLTAFQQVEDYLAATRILSQQIIKQHEAVDAAQTTLDLETERFRTGIDPYIDVTTAQVTLLSDQESLVTLQIQEAVASIELIQALGGGWDESQLPTPAQLSAKPAKTDYEIQR